MSEVTRILCEIGQGKAKAAEELLPIVYEELRRLAAFKMALEQPGQTLQPTALVHEAWLRLTGDEGARFENRGHFFAAAAEAMRRILIDRARERKALKRGGHFERVDWDQVTLATGVSDEMWLAVNEALDKLAQHDRQTAKFVELRFFAGLTNEEAALALGVPERTARRHWTFAKAWLYREIQRQGQA